MKTLNDLLLTLYPLRMLSVLNSGDYIWFSACNFNGLFQADLTTGITKYLGQFETDDADDTLLYSAIYDYHGTLYFTPLHSKYVSAYDCRKHKFYAYRIPDKRMDTTFYGTAGIDDKLFFWNADKLEIFIFHMVTKKFKILNNQYNSILREKQQLYFEGIKEDILWRDFEVVGKSIYIPSPAYGIILEIDMLKETMKCHNIGKFKNYYTVCFDGIDFWITGEKNLLLKWNKDKQQSESYIVTEDLPIENARLSFYCNEKIYFSFYKYAGIAIYDVKNHIWDKISCILKGNAYWKACFFSLENLFFSKSNNSVLTFSNLFSQLIKINANSNTVVNLKIQEGADYFFRDRHKAWCKKNYYKEEYHNVPYLETYLANLSDDQKKNLNIPYINLGQIIYNTILMQGKR